MAGFLFCFVNSFWNQLLFVCLQQTGKTWNTIQYNLCLYVICTIHYYYIVLLNSQEYSQLGQLCYYTCDFRTGMHCWQKSRMGIEGKVDKKKKYSKVQEFWSVRAESKISDQVLMCAFVESFKSPSHWSNATSTGKDGAACKIPALVCHVQQDSARIAALQQGT